MIGDHPLFKRPDNEDIKLWRYMDLTKFLSLIAQEAVYFTRSDLLGDPFEGSVPRVNAEFLHRAKANRQTDPNFSFFKDMPDAQMDGMIAQDSTIRRQFRREIFVSCWHMNEVESLAMWKLYSSSSESVCVQTTFKKLAAALPPQIYGGEVQYIDFQRDAILENNAFAPFLRKRASFEFEREFRAVGWLSPAPDHPLRSKAVGDGVGLSIEVDVTQLIEVVFINPEAPQWFANIVRDVCRRYDFMWPIHQSSLGGQPTFGADDLR